MTNYEKEIHSEDLHLFENLKLNKDDCMRVYRYDARDTNGKIFNDSIRLKTKKEKEEYVPLNIGFNHFSNDMIFPEVYVGDMRIGFIEPIHYNSEGRRMYNLGMLFYNERSDVYKKHVVYISDIKEYTDNDETSPTFGLNTFDVYITIRKG